jgi:23S rRNA (guanosine2251-2'-O)-methyltransferase
MSSAFVAFGKNVVVNLIKSNFFVIKRIILRKEEYRNERNLISLIEEKKINYRILEKNDFNKYNVDKKSQGIIAFIKEYKYTPLKEMLFFAPKRKFPLLFVLDCIEDPHNLGAIVRTLAAFDVDGLIISKKNQVQVNSTVIKVSTGGVSYLPICQVDSINSALNEIKKKKFRLISTACNENAKIYDEISFEYPTCVILGNEHDGIKKNLIKRSDSCVYIPMSNNMNSLNVSVSCGIICSRIISEWKRSG